MKGRKKASLQAASLKQYSLFKEVF